MGELRQRIIDARQINPDTIMPPYHSIEGLHHVQRRHVGRPILSAQNVEDLIAYLEGRSILFGGIRTARSPERARLSW